MSKPNVKVTIHLWTNDLPCGESENNCWNIGQVSVQKHENPMHVITGGNAVKFNRPDDLYPMMMKALADAGITVHTSRRSA